MQVYSQYVLNTIPILALGVPIYALARLLYVKAKKRPLNAYREAGLLVFSIYLLWLATQTIVPNISIIDEVWSLGQPGFGEVNLELFKVFRQTYHEVALNGNDSYFFINFLGNILVFIPVAFFALLLFKKRKRPLLYSAELGLCVSLFIECVQFFIERGCDIDDLWLNTLGAWLGGLLYLLLSKRLSRFFERFKPVAAEKAKADNIIS